MILRAAELRRSSALPTAGLGLNASDAIQFAVDSRHPLNLSSGREAFVETLAAKSTRLFGPRRQPRRPTLEAVLGWLGVFGREIGANANHSLQSHWLGHHV